MFATIPAAAARADMPTRGEMLERVQTVSEISGRASETADLAVRGGIVALIARHGDLSRDDAGLMLDAVTGTVISLSEMGERSGMLEIPDIETAYDTVLGLMGSVDPQARQALAKATHYRSYATETDERLSQIESEVMIVLMAGRRQTFSPDIERWRPIVEEYFPIDQVDDALAVMDCESEGDPRAENRRSRAAGLFQFLNRTWSHASAAAGFDGASAFEPEASIAAAAWLVGDSLDRGNDAWQQWSCKP